MKKYIFTFIVCISVLFAVNPVETSWENLTPKGFSPDDILSKYSDKINTLDDSSPEADKLYQKIMKEINNAPLVTKIANKNIKIPGFVVPLTQKGDIVSEFLLVPYFGACIHTPPPPSNQIIIVKTKKGQGIKSEDIYMPVWVNGKITLDGEKTDVAEAGYSILNANVNPYELEE